MEGPELAESIANAIANGNLTWERPPINKTLALGVASMRVRRRGKGFPPNLLVRLATVVYRLKLAGDAKQYEDAEDAVRGLASALSRRWGWRTPPGALRSMSRTVLRYWLADNCRECTGRRFQRVPGSPALSARVCPECGGSGKASRPWEAADLRGAVVRAREGEYHDALFAELQGIESEVNRVIASLLRS